MPVEGSPGRDPRLQEAGALGQHVADDPRYVGCRLGPQFLLRSEPRLDPPAFLGRYLVEDIRLHETACLAEEQRGPLLAEEPSSPRSRISRRSLKKAAWQAGLDGACDGDLLGDHSANGQSPCLRSGKESSQRLRHALPTILHASQILRIIMSTRTAATAMAPGISILGNSLRGFTVPGTKRNQMRATTSRPSA